MAPEQLDRNRIALGEHGQEHVLDPDEVMISGGRLLRAVGQDPLEPWGAHFVDAAEVWIVVRTLETHSRTVPASGVREAAIGPTMDAVPIDDTAPLRPTPRYRDVLRHAEDQARRHRHRYLGDEHLLLGILDGGQSPATAAIAKFVDLPTVRRELERILASESYAKSHPESPTRPRDADARSDSVPVLLARGDERQQAVIHWWWTGRGPEDTYRAELEWSGPAVQVSAHDMFEVLVRIREQLEPQGWLVAVQGSRLDTFPSGMQRDMGGGLSVYVMRMGEAARLEDVVDTLAEADPRLLATVAAQRDHAAAWRRSVDREGSAR